MLNVCASFVVFLGLFKSVWGTGLAWLWMLLTLGQWGGPQQGSFGVAAGIASLLHKRGGREKVHLDAIPPHHCRSSLWLQGARPLPFPAQLLDPLKHKPLGCSQWAHAREVPEE